MKKFQQFSMICFNFSAILAYVYTMFALFYSLLSKTPLREFFDMDWWLMFIVSSILLQLVNKESSITEEE